MKAFLSNRVEETQFKEAAFKAANRVEPRVTLVPMLVKSIETGVFLFLPLSI
jgi:hypothetical protein